MQAYDFILIFFLGFFSCGFIVSLFFVSDIETPFSYGDEYSLDAPSDWISEDDITLLDDKLIISIDNAKISSYKPTGSMRPVLDEGANGIRVVPKNPEDISIGDIVSFNKNGMLIVHRVVEKSVDAEGYYYITKGDNNEFFDGIIRFENIEYVTIGILY